VLEADSLSTPAGEERLPGNPVCGNDRKKMKRNYNQNRRSHCAAANPYNQGLTIMLAILVLMLAALSRLLPHMIHSVAFNFTAVGAGLLFFGSRRPRWQTVLAVAVMALMDVYLTTKVYGYAFHVSAYMVTWAWYAAVCLMGSALLRKVTVLRVVGGVLASATSFFVLSNFMVWRGSVGGVMYPHSVAGLAGCYAAALPFYGNDLISTGAFAAAFFGLPALVTRLAEMMPSAQEPTV
jgi:hypothetical protein